MVEADQDLPSLPVDPQDLAAQHLPGKAVLHSSTYELGGFLSRFDPGDEENQVCVALGLGSSPIARDHAVDFRSRHNPQLPDWDRWEGL